MLAKSERKPPLNNFDLLAQQYETSIASHFPLALQRLGGFSPHDIRTPLLQENPD
jgi:hypothetical protein